jgi:predicted chitinase
LIKNHVNDVVHPSLAVEVAFSHLATKFPEEPRILATDPGTAVDASIFFWTSRNLNAIADQDNVTRVTEKVNGGHNGLANRKAILARAKFFLMKP